MEKVKIGIIGVGPRGLTVLERIVAHERVRKSTDIEVYLFDPSEPGTGCHYTEQPDHLLVNTVARQITQFSDWSIKGAGPIMEGPSFYHWLQDQSYISKLHLGQERAPISPDGYYSRSLFGRYLQWVYHYLLELAPGHVQIQFVKALVTNADRETEDAWLLETEEGSLFRTNYLFLTTGHTKPRTASMSHAAEGCPAMSQRSGGTIIVNNPYPIKQTLSFIKPDMTVAIEGMGLTTFDVLSELTVGRGGHFAASPASGEMQYIASGNEPRIVAFSRSGLPLTARAVNQKGTSIQYRPRFLLLEKVRELRAVRKLDFVADILPLLLSDMEYAYYEAYLRERCGSAASLLFCNRFVCADAVQRRALIAERIPLEDRFSWNQLAAPIPETALAARADFKAWLTMHLRQDLHEARKGNLDSPLKAASDVLRDLRDNLRAAIDFGGLTQASHRWLYSEFLPVMNRVAVGPPKERIEEMLALMGNGVLSADWGPETFCERSPDTGLMRVMSRKWPEQTTDIHVLIKARVSMHSPQDDASPLLQRLLKAGHVRPFYNGAFHPGGLEINCDFNLVSEQGKIVDNAWALGVPTEGIKFYTFVVPRPGVNSTALVDAGRAVGKMLSMISERTNASGATRANEEQACPVAY